MQDNLIRRNSQLSYESPETWLPNNLPVQSTINTFSAYAVAHESSCGISFDMAKELYWLDQTKLDWFKARGCSPHNVCTGISDLIVWDSRTIQYGSEPAETSSLVKCKTVFIITICRLYG
ncbi:hypothetical protein VN97_g4628 [Penicillium thymicola]|uniref:Uncharacterized protein n=1 Tax=Penicillium thymicola TaxID=293382 RepID=A0AAI9X9Y8_PENTH|nr:hypothetical protein VN97_g4628 [Penicillium thymicola]